MNVQLNPKIPVGHGIWGQRNWVSYISGHWNGRWGKGTVVVSAPFTRMDPPSLSSCFHGNVAEQLDASPADKTPNSSLQISRPISIANTSYRLMTIPLLTLRSSMRGGGLGRERCWRNWRIRRWRMR